MIAQVECIRDALLLSKRKDLSDRGGLGTVRGQNNRDYLLRRLARQRARIAAGRCRASRMRGRRTGGLPID